MPTKQEIEDRVRTIVAEQIGEELSRIQADAKFSDLGIDSLDHVELCMATEDEFGILIGDEDWNGVTSVDGIVDLVAGYKVLAT